MHTFFLHSCLDLSCLNFFFGGIAVISVPQPVDPRVYSNRKWSTNVFVQKFSIQNAYPEICLTSIRICHVNVYSARTGKRAVVLAWHSKPQKCQTTHPFRSFLVVFSDSLVACFKQVPVQSRWPRELQPFLSRTKKTRTLIRSPLSFPKCGRSWKSPSITTL